MEEDDKMEEENFEKPGYFPFPFPPYDIQEQFMKCLYKAIESGKVGLFESPTGTVWQLALISCWRNKRHHVHELLSCHAHGPAS